MSECVSLWPLLAVPLLVGLSQGVLPWRRWSRWYTRAVPLRVFMRTMHRGSGSGNSLNCFRTLHSGHVGSWGQNIWFAYESVLIPVEMDLWLFQSFLLNLPRHRHMWFLLVSLCHGLTEWGENLTNCEMLLKKLIMIYFFTKIQKQHAYAAVHLSSEIGAGKIVFSEFLCSSRKVGKFKFSWHKYMIK